MNPRKQTNSFTIVEFLVVLSIIAILAGMLIPALARARRNGTAARILRPASQPNEAYQFTVISKLSTLSDVDYLIRTDSNLTVAVTIPKRIDSFPTTITVSKGTNYSTEWKELVGKDVFVITFPYNCEVVLHPEESSQMVKDAERLAHENDEFWQGQEKKLLETEVQLKLPEGSTGWSQLFLGEIGGGFGFSVIVENSGPFVPSVFVFQLSTCSKEVMSAGFTFKVTKPELLSVTGTTVLWGNKPVPIVSVSGALDIQPLVQPEKETKE